MHRNGGTCSKYESVFACTCLDGYGGQMCQFGKFSKNDTNQDTKKQENSVRTIKMRINFYFLEFNFSLSNLFKMKQDLHMGLSRYLFKIDNTPSWSWLTIFQMAIQIMILIFIVIIVILLKNKI